MTRLLIPAFFLLLTAAIGVPNYLPYAARAAAAPRHGPQVSQLMGRRLVSHLTGGSCGLYCDYDHDCSIAGGPCGKCDFNPGNTFYHKCGGGSCGTYCDYSHDCDIAGGPCRTCDFTPGSPTYHLCA